MYMYLTCVYTQIIIAVSHRAFFPKTECVNGILSLMHSVLLIEVARICKTVTNSFYGNKYAKK